MGQQYCCKSRVVVKLPDLQQDLHIHNCTLLEEVARLREEHASYIAVSSIYCSTEGAIFRGKLDKNRHKLGYGQFYQKQHGYFGRFENDLPQGYGLAIKDTQQYYRGNFDKGLFHGTGKQYGPNYEFEGEFECGHRKNGIFKNDHFEYQGHFAQNTFHGEGRIIFTNGASYEGLFSNGKFEGLGILALENGKYYRGEFKECKFHGNGKMRWLQGAKRQKYVRPAAKKPNQLASSNVTLVTEVKATENHETRLQNSLAQKQTAEPIVKKVEI